MTTSAPPAKPAAKKPAARSAAKPAAKPVEVQAVAEVAVAAEVQPAAAEIVTEAPPVAAPVAVAAETPAEIPVVTSAVIPVAAIEPVVASLTEAGAKAQAATLKSYEDVSAVARDALDAVVASSEVLSKGLQDLGNTVYGLTQQSFDEGVAVAKQIMAAKTVREAVDLQAALAKSQFDRLLAEAPRLGEQSLKLVEDAVAPLSASVTAAVDKLVKAAA